MVWYSMARTGTDVHTRLVYRRLFFHRVQLLVCIIVACGWYLVLTKKASELDHIVAFGKRIGEQEVLLFTTACASVIPRHLGVCVCVVDSCLC